MGVYKTTDGGKNWNPTALNWNLTDNKVIYGMEMNPQNASVLIAATSDGIYKTRDGGNHWDRIRTENFSDIKFKPGDTSVVYAAYNDYWGESNIFKSIDGGNTFVKASDFALQKVFLRIATTEADGNYVGVNMSVDGARKFYLSKDEAKTFDYVSDPPENSVLSFSQQYRDVLYCGYLVIYTSANGGKDWFQITDWWNSGQGFPEIHADHHFIVTHPLRKDEVYFCCDGGVYRMNETTGLWDELVNGLPVTQFYKLGVSTTIPPVIIGGSQDNGGWIKRSDGSWGNTNGGDAMSQVIDPTDKNTGYTEYWGGNAVYRSTDGFNYLEDITPNIGAELPGQWVTPFSLNPKNPKTFIIGYNEIFVSFDRCNSFKKITNNLTGNKENDLRDVKINPADTNMIVATRGNYMYISRDFGKTWKTTALISTLEITGFEFDPDNANHLWCSRSGFGTFKVMTSVNGGLNWVNISKNFANTPVTCLVYDAPTRTLFAGTDLGVMYTNADSIDWKFYGNGLPHTSVSDMKIHKSLRKLIVSTYGRGFYSIDLPDCSTTELNILWSAQKTEFKDKPVAYICQNTDMLLRARDSLEGTYHWIFPNFDTTIYNNPVLSGIKNYQTYTLPEGKYILEFTAVNGCVQFDTLDVKFLNIPGEIINVTPDHTLNCHLDSLLLSIAPGVDTTLFNYSWISPNAAISYNSTLYASELGSYYLQLRAKNQDDFCNYIESFDLFRTYDPLISDKKIQPNFCYGDSAAQIKVEVISGKSPYQYIWSDPKEHTDLLKDIPAGSYSLKIIDANGCETQDTFIVTDPPDFNVQITSNPSNGNDGSIIITLLQGATPPYNFKWYFNQVLLQKTSRDIDNLEPGIYNVVITDANGCSFISPDIEVKEFVAVNNKEQNGFALYPNPARDYLVITLQKEYQAQMQFELIDIHGRIIALNEIKIINPHQLQINTAKFPAGEYILKIKSPQGFQEKKFSKM
jgi:photosystem II stability/assembly factor-like uncharacterized protein